MTDTVDAVQGATVSPAISEFYLPPDQVEDGSQLDKDAFLKLLVAQLKYQDPLDPSNSEEFIATTAQFTTIEKLDQIAKQGENSALITSLSTASSLVGRSVTFTGDDGVPVEAVVERSQLVGGEVRLITDAGAVGLNQIIGVGGPATAADAVNTGATGSGGTATGSTEDSSTETSSTESSSTQDSSTTDEHPVGDADTPSSTEAPDTVPTETTPVDQPNPSTESESELIP